MKQKVLESLRCIFVQSNCEYDFGCDPWWPVFVHVGLFWSKNSKIWQKFVYFGIWISLHIFLINKKIVFTEKRYLLKFNSIKWLLLLIKLKQTQKDQNKSEWNHSWKNRSNKSACANIIFELPFTNFSIIFQWM